MKNTHVSPSFMAGGDTRKSHGRANVKKIVNLIDYFCV